ncbi:MAG TPA: DUF2231 domain-containing protein [Anaerolineae bacterium]|nr:DUF2231 domain-containing protein [Anaerolineae bacterium]
MESKAKILGHAIHPMLIVLPLGLLIAAVIFDALYFITANQSLAVVGFWNMAAGIIGGLLAAIFGLWDWLAIPGGTRAKSVGLWHGAGNVVVVILFAIAWLLRWNQPAYEPTTLVFILELLGLGLGAVTGWLGGELVERLGVGVDRGAHLNAPNSLSGRPASETDAAYQGEITERSRMRS